MRTSGSTDKINFANTDTINFQNWVFARNSLCLSWVHTCGMLNFSLLFLLTSYMSYGEMTITTLAKCTWDVYDIKTEHCRKVMEILMTSCRYKTNTPWLMQTVLIAVCLYVLNFGVNWRGGVRGEGAFPDPALYKHHIPCLTTPPVRLNWPSTVYTYIASAKTLLFLLDVNGHLRSTARLNVLIETLGTGFESSTG